MRRQMVRMAILVALLMEDSCSKRTAVVVALEEQERIMAAVGAVEQGPLEQ